MCGLLPRSLPSPIPCNSDLSSGSSCLLFCGDLRRLIPGRLCCSSKRSLARSGLVAVVGHGGPFLSLSLGQNVPSAWFIVIIASCMYIFYGPPTAPSHYSPSLPCPYAGLGRWVSGGWYACHAPRRPPVAPCLPSGGRGLGAKCHQTRVVTKADDPEHSACSAASKTIQRHCTPTVLVLYARGRL